MQEFLLDPNEVASLRIWETKICIYGGCCMIFAGYEENKKFTVVKMRSDESKDQI